MTRPVLPSASQTEKEVIRLLTDSVTLGTVHPRDMALSAKIAPGALRGDVMVLGAFECLLETLKAPSTGSKAFDWRGRTTHLEPDRKEVIQASALALVKHRCPH